MTMKGFLWLAIGCAIFIACALSSGCVRIEIDWPGHRVEDHGAVHGYDGVYKVWHASYDTVQNVWKSRADKSVRHLEVWSFVDIKAKEIWYTTKSSLKQEVKNIQSPAAMMEARRHDLRAAFPILRPRRIR